MDKAVRTLQRHNGVVLIARVLPSEGKVQLTRVEGSSVSQHFFNTHELSEIVRLLSELPGVNIDYPGNVAVNERVLG